MKVLFIDDEPENIKSFMQAFELSNYDIEVISNVDDAWKIVQAESPEILAIILDIMMPPGDLLEYEKTKQGLRSGVFFIEKIKQFDERIPVVILTNVDKSELVNITHRNFLVYEKKDISPWSLVEKVSDMKRKVY